jgi:acyl carrier protein
MLVFITRASESGHHSGAVNAPRLPCGGRSLIVAPPELMDVQMSSQTEAEHELAQLLVESLNLEGVEPAQIDPQAPLFNDGLGLDSIDALELALAIGKQYGVQLRSEGEQNRHVFASLQALSAHVQSQRTR